MRALGLIFLLMWLAACRTLPVAGACPESRALRCLTAPVCTYDRDRGCMECRCGEASPRLERQPDNGTRPTSPPADPTHP